VRRGQQEQSPREQALHLTQRLIASALYSDLCLCDMQMLQQSEIVLSETVRGDKSMDDLKVFIVLLYVRREYCGKSMMWSDFGPIVMWWTFSETMPRKHFREIMRHLRFDDIRPIRV
jgi:hypothetical protein